jgi:hypothetical protein
MLNGFLSFPHSLVSVVSRDDDSGCSDSSMREDVSFHPRKNSMLTGHTDIPLETEIRLGYSFPTVQESESFPFPRHDDKRCFPENR